MFIQRKKILFFSHAVTLAHFVRPLRWIECLDLDRYEVYFASSPNFRNLLPKTGVSFIEISCIDPATFSEIVVQARPIYDAITFASHVEEDLQVIEKVVPDIVVGDFRHSLSVSCRIKKVKYINITNAYWSPEIKLPYPMPEAPIVRWLGEKFFAVFVAPFAPFLLRLNFFKMVFLIRKSLARVNLKFKDYRQIITDGDLTLFCDTPELIPLKIKLKNEIFIGPLTWSMQIPPPAWWGNLKEESPRIFVSLGSSGDIRLLPMILKALSKIDAEIVVALSGKKIELPDYPNVYLADFLPIDASFQKFSLVICNGGSPMCHSALAWGLPTLGIVCNNDQLLNMAHIQQRGAGIMLRYWNLTEEKFIAAIHKILSDGSFRSNASIIQKEFARIDVSENLRNIINENI